MCKCGYRPVQFPSTYMKTSVCTGENMHTWVLCAPLFLPCTCLVMVKLLYTQLSGISWSRLPMISQVQINHQQPQSRPLPCKVCLNPQCSFSVVYSPHNGSHTGGFLKLSSDGLKPVTITSQPLMGGGMGGMATPSTSQNSSATTNNDTKKDNPFLQWCDWGVNFLHKIVHWLKIHVCNNYIPSMWLSTHSTQAIGLFDTRNVLLTLLHVYSLMQCWQPHLLFSVFNWDS